VKGWTVADFLDEKRKEIQDRLKELRPLVDEFHRLEAAERALSGMGNSKSSTGTTAAAAPTRRRRRSTGNGRRRGRPRGTGTRAQQALDLVKDRPGITIPEMAQAMGIQQNYLYRVLPGLAEEGKVVRSGRGWHLRDQS
jgi:CRP-like cAMP-binding protein